MPTRRIHDTAGQAEPDIAVVPPAEPYDYPEAAEVPAEGYARAEPEPEVAASEPEPGFSAKQTESLERLRRLGSRRSRLRAELEDLERELLGEAIIEGFKLGIPKRVIAKESQVVRQTVYNVIERGA